MSGPDIPRVRRYGATPGETFAREGMKPTARQVYAIARRRRGSCPRCGPEHRR